MGSFAGSSTSRAEVTIYSHGDDAVLRAPRRGRCGTRGDITKTDEPALVHVHTSKRMGAGPGTFQVELKAPPRVDLLDVWADDDWVDISFQIFDRHHHVMRGLIDRVELVESTNGATADTYVITGREFAKVFADTEVWFNRYSDEDATGELSLRAWGQNVLGVGDVAETVRVYLQGFLRALNGRGRNLWPLPSSLPGVGSATTAADAVQVWSRDLTNIPPRHAFNPNFLLPPETSLWALAQDWSDPEFTELYPELLVPAGGELAYVGDGDSAPDRTRMAVVLRDRPFPTNTSPGGINNSPWFHLRERDVPWGHIRNPRLSRGGAERINTIMVSPQLTQEVANAPFSFSEPLWSKKDIARHGVRRYDMRSRYVCDAPDLNLTLSKVSRERLRDWHALNPYFRSGTLPIKPGRPEIRIGSRIRIPGAAGPDSDLRCYVEGVDHDWSLEPGVSSTLTVTRGWKGTEQSMIAAIQRLAADYAEPVRHLDAGF